MDFVVRDRRPAVVDRGCPRERHTSVAARCGKPSDQARRHAWDTIHVLELGDTRPIGVVGDRDLQRPQADGALARSGQNDGAKQRLGRSRRGDRVKADDQRRADPAGECADRDAIEENLRAIELDRLQARPLVADRHRNRRGIA